MLKIGDYLKVTGFKVKNDNDIFVVNAQYENEEYCLYKVTITGEVSKSKYRILFLKPKHFTDSSISIEILPGKEALKQAKKEVNDYLKGITQTEIVYSFVDLEGQRLNKGGYIKVTKPISLVSSIYSIPTGTIYTCTHKGDEKTNYTFHMIGKKGEPLSSYNASGFNKILLAFQPKTVKTLFNEGYIVLVDRIEQTKGDLTKEIPALIEPSEEVIESLNFETVEEVSTPVGEAPAAPINEEKDQDIITYSLSDIPYNLAYHAYLGTSFVPEDRAVSVQNAYVEHLKNLCADLVPLAKSEEEKEILKAELLRYKAKYLNLYKALLSAKSRTLSPMITGPSNFPTRRNEKALNVEHKRRTEFLNWQEKAIKAIRSKICPGLSGIISSDDPEAITKLQAKIDSAEHNQSLMKQANAVLRKDLTEEQKVSALLELGLSESAAREVLKPDTMGRVGFPDYVLSNNNANIRRMKSRIEELKQKSSQETQEQTIGTTIIKDNVEANRVQILFPDKPDESIRKTLRSNGFLWSPSNQAWQRKRSERALYLAKKILEEAI